MTSEKAQATTLRTIENPVIRDRVTFISLAEETGQALTEISVTLMPGGGTPLHYHRQLIETFEAISGVLGLEADGVRHLLQAGSAITVAAGTVHRFYNPGTEPVVFNTRISPGSTGFEQSLRVLYGLAADGLTDRKSRPRSLVHLAILSELGDMYMTGALALLHPVLRRLTRKAKRSGEYDALIQRYCSNPA